MPETKSDVWGATFPPGWSTVAKHLYCGQRNLGAGAYFHRKRAIELIWGGNFIWHSWAERALKSFCDYRWVTWTGPAASAKSTNASLFALVYWMELPSATSVIMASTTRAALSRRLWYYVQDFHSKIPAPLSIGQPLYTEHMIRYRPGDKKNGIFGLAVEEGPVEEALHNLIGYHNDRVLLVVDEAQGTREAIFRACDNLAKNPEFRALLLGNAESREDPHGRFSEPIGGWLGVDPDTAETWETRGGPTKGRGCCVFFDGRRSPAIMEPAGAKKYPFLINQEQISAALEYHRTADDPRFWSQSIGFWPPIGFTQTVLDERIVVNKKLREAAIWYTSFRWCAAFDPSYEGGDRKVFQPFKLGQVPTDEGGDLWLIEFAEPQVIKLSVRDEEELHYQIFNQCVARCRELNIPPDRFATGSSGEGGGLYSIFRREWGEVEGIEEAGLVSDRPVSAVNPKSSRDEYDRVVSELWFAVREFALNGCIRNMPGEAIKEFCARRWANRNKKVRVETKEEMRDHYPRSPDFADAVAFSVELARRLGAVAGVEIKHEGRKDWKEAQAAYDDVVSNDDSFLYQNAID